MKRDLPNLLNLSGLKAVPQLPPSLRHIPTVRLDERWWRTSSTVMLLVLLALTFQFVYQMLRTAVVLPQAGRRAWPKLPSLRLVQPQGPGPVAVPPEVAPIPFPSARVTPAVRSAPVERSGIFAPFFYAPFALGFVATAAAAAGFFVYWTAQGWIALQLTADPLRLSALLSISTVPMLSILVFGRPLADPLNHRAWVFLLRIAVAAVLGWMAYAASRDGLTVPVFIGASALLGLLWSIDLPGRFLRPAGLVPPQHAANARYWLLLTQSAALAGAPIAAGSLLFGGGAASVLWLAAGAYTVLALLMLALRQPSDDSPHPDPVASPILRAGPARFRGAITLLTALLASGVLAIAPIVAAKLATNVVGYGWLIGAVGLGSLAGLLAAAVLGTGWGSRLATTAGLALAVASLIGMAYVTTLGLTLALMATVGAGVGLAGGATLRAAAHEPYRGRVRLQGAATPLWALTPPVTIAVGALASQYGVAFAIWALGIAAAVLLVVLATGRGAWWTVASVGFTDDRE